MIRSPSEKQILLADNIADLLSIEFPRGDFDFSAYVYWKFIQNHLQEFNDTMDDIIAKNNFEDITCWGSEFGLWEF